MSEPTTTAAEVKIGDTIVTREHAFPFTITEMETRRGYVWVGYLNQVNRKEWHRMPPTETVTVLPCKQCQEQAGKGGPPHKPSERCESGKHPHCSCDTCF